MADFSKEAIEAAAEAIYFSQTGTDGYRSSSFKHTWDRLAKKVLKAAANAEPADDPRRSRAWAAFVDEHEPHPSDLSVARRAFRAGWNASNAPRTETTAYEPLTDEIIEQAARAIDPGSWKIRDGGPFPPEHPAAQAVVRESMEAAQRLADAGLLDRHGQ